MGAARRARPTQPRHRPSRRREQSRLTSRGRERATSTCSMPYLADMVLYRITETTPAIVGRTAFHDRIRRHHQADDQHRVQGRGHAREGAAGSQRTARTRSPRRRRQRGAFTSSACSSSLTARSSSGRTTSSRRASRLQPGVPLGRLVNVENGVLVDARPKACTRPSARCSHAAEPASARWMRFALAFGLPLALGVAVMNGAAQEVNILINGRNLQTHINDGLPTSCLASTFCRRPTRTSAGRESPWLGVTTIRQRTTTSWWVSPS